MGRQARAPVDREILGDDKKLTVEEKIERELGYMAEALDLEGGDLKHWRYKLKREYEA